jgi:hypothetical protein
LRDRPDQKKRRCTYMNPTVILGIAALVIETALTAIQLIKKQTRKKKEGNTH